MTVARAFVPALLLGLLAACGGASEESIRQESIETFTEFVELLESIGTREEAEAADARLQALDRKLQALDAEAEESGVQPPDPNDPEIRDLRRRAQAALTKVAMLQAGDLLDESLGNTGAVLQGLSEALNGSK